MRNDKQRLVALIRSHVGQRIAIRHGDRDITYADLGRLVDERAELVRRHGGGFVALERPRSADFVLDYLAVLAAGGVAVPIDPRTPRERRAAFLDLVRPDLLWTVEGVERLPGGARDAHPDGAFVYFTSGSTGRPKPVLGSAAAVLRFVTWFGPEYGVGAHDRFMFGAGVSFEASLRDIFPPLANGATLVVPEGDAVDPGWMARHGITVVTAVPSVARTWLWPGDTTCPDVRAAFFVGEPLTGDVVERWPAVFPSTAFLVNSYGSTESGQGTIVKRVTPGTRVGRVPAGRPVPGTRVCLIDPGTPMTAAVVGAALDGAAASGEIVIVGPACSRGYLGMPDENRARFADLGDGITAYRTGDLGHLDADGDLVVIGRADDEVKINGVRVHPAEVTRALRDHPAVADAFVTTVPRLTGFLVLAGVPAGVPDVAALRRDLMDTLPLAMIPARFVVLDELPKGRTGKVDREALVRLADRPVDAPYVAPAGDLERWVADRFGELFGVARVSAADDFFALGGDSIAATRLCARAGHDLGVDLTQRAVFAAATVTGIATAIGDRRIAGPEPIPRLPRDGGALPMSPAQRRLAFLQKLHPQSPAYNTVEAVRLSGRVDVDALNSAVVAVLTRHEVLRCRVGDDALVVTALPATPMDVVDVPDGDPLPLFADLADRPFDLEAETPVRVTLARLGSGEHALLFVVHHIASDAWSGRLLVDEVLRAYVGDDLPALPVRYADVAAWQNDRLAGDAMRRHADYWRDRLDGVPPVLELPRDRPRPPVRSDAGDDLRLDLDTATRDRLRRVAHDAGVTPFALLLTAFGYVLHRHCATDDVVLGIPVSGRDRVELEPLVGCFINTVVLRLDLGTAPTRRDLVRRIWDGMRADLEHREMPFEELVARLSPGRDLAVGQLVQVMMNQYPATEPDDVPGLRVAPLDVPRRRAKFDLTCTVVDSADRTRITLTYATDLLDRATVDRIGGHLRAVLDALLADLDAPVVELPPVPPGEPVPSSTVDAPAGEPVLHRFEAHARTHPDRAAVWCPDGTLSYRELNERANRLARYLLASAPGDGPVALLFDRTADHVVAMLAALKAGRAYVPLDPAQPPAHLAGIAACADLVLTHSAVDRLPGMTSVDIDELAPVLGGQPVEDPGLPHRPDGVMYVLFTSGSTGRPKGVVVEHRNFTAYLTSVLCRMRLPDGLSYALVSTLAADLGLTNLYGALATGGTLHLLPYEWATDPDRFAAHVRAHRVDVMKLVPSHLQALAEAGRLSEVVPARHLVLAGEACPWDLVDAVRAARPDCTVWNHYGPTETTVSVLAYEVPDPPPDDRGATVPLGQPLDHVRVSIVDRNLRPVPRGAAGELLIAGPSVARYLSTEDGGFVAGAYRSGDRVRLRADGTVEFLGRLDRQAKIRGYRVEPGHVEAVLRRHPAVADAAVAVRADHTGRAQLVAWYRRHDGTGPPLTEFARAALPPYLVPAAFVEVDRFPLTRNGKLDWSALPDPRADDRPPTTAPRDGADARMLDAWRAVLGRDDLGIDDDFFDAGGDSFAAMRLVRAVGGGVRVVSVFQHPTVRALVDHLGTAGDGLLRRMPGPGGTGPVTATVVAVPFGGGSAAVYAELARVLPPGFPLYGVDLPGHDPARPDQPTEPFDAVAVRCVAEIRRAVDGPIVLYGHCVGAALAFDLARRLTADGAHVVGFVAGGAYPAPRLPGRVFDLWARLMPGDRWRSDRLYRDVLRSTGGLAAVLTDAEQSTLLRALRHDVREAEDIYSRLCHDPAHRPVLPALCVVGERDRITEFHDERHREWNLLCAGTDLAVIPAAGHYFLKHQADELARIITAWVRTAAPSAAPPPAAPPPPSAAPPAAKPSPATSRPAPPAATPPAATPPAAPPARRARPSLRGFALVTIGQLLSLTGSRALAFALGIWVYLRTGSVTQFSVILVTALLPGLLALPFAGAAADRWNRRLLMVAGELINAAGAALCLLALATGSLRVWHVYVAAGLGSVAASVQQPAYLAAVAQLVPKQYLSRTNGVQQAVVAASQAMGPLVGGALMVAVGLGGVLVTDLAAVLLALVTLAAVRVPDLRFRHRDESIWAEIRGGLRYIARRRSLVAMIVFFLTYNLLLGFALVLIPPMVLSFSTTATLSLATILGAAGGIAGGIAMALWGGFDRRATGMVGFAALTGAGMIMAGAHPAPVFPTLGLAVIMASIALINGHWQTMIQVKVGVELQGRILATNRMTANLTEPVGYLCAGWLADAVFEPAMAHDGALSGALGPLLGTGPGRGMAALVVGLGVVLVGLTAAGMRWRVLRYMEDLLPDAVPGARVTWDRDALQREADDRLRTR